MNTILAIETFERASINSMVIVSLSCVVIPFIILALIKIKLGGKISSFFIGMGFYIIFAMFLSVIINMIFHSIPIFKILFDKANHPVFYGIYGAIVAAIVEETGKFFCMKVLNKYNRTGKYNALLGVYGHAAFETVAYGSSLFMGNVILAVMVNSIGLDEYLKKLGHSGDALIKERELVIKMMNIPISEHFISGTFCLLTLILQTALGILVYISFKESAKKYYLFMAMGLHFLGYLPNYLTNLKVITNSILSIGIVAALCLFTAYFARMEFIKQKE